MGIVQIQGDYLFSRRGDFTKLEQEILGRIEKEIKSLDKEILSMDEEALVQELVHKYSIEPIQLREKDIRKFSEDEEFHVDPNPVLGILERKIVNGTRIIIEMPFEGSAEVFYYRPTTFSTVYPQGIVYDQVIRVEYLVYADDGTNLKKTHEQNFKVLKEYIAWINRDIEKFNRELPIAVTRLIKRRKNKLLSDEKLLDSLS